MKRMLQILSGCLISFLFVGNDIYAQDIEGLEINSKVTKAEIIEKFGTPDEYEIQRWAPGDGMNEKGEFFRYDIDAANPNPSKDGLIIDLMDDTLDRFVIGNSKYRAFTNLVKGGVRVGESFSAINGLLNFEEIGSRGEIIIYRAMYSKFYHSVVVYVKDGKITNIACIVGEG